ncbi:hypothetical protein BJX99DRAFT_242625, partial [Aspergillus californicus]
AAEAERAGGKEGNGNRQRSRYARASALLVFMGLRTISKDLNISAMTHGSFSVKCEHQKGQMDEKPMARVAQMLVTA